MIRRHCTTWSDAPVFLLVPDSASSEIPDDLAANLDHAIRLVAKIERLKIAQKEAMQAAAEAARRWRPINADIAQRLCDVLRDDEIPHRGLVREALGVGSSNIRIDRCVVYVLLHNNQVVYVGRSMNNARERVASHRASGKVFDEVHVYQCRNDRHMRDLEAVLIEQHAPRFNQRREPKVPGEAS
jgi:hypothetical protein